MERPMIPDFHHPGYSGRIGVTRRDITPPIGIYARNWGAATHDVAESVHRPLTLTALTIMSSSSDNPLVLLDADLGWWKTPGLFNRFKSRLLQEFSLPSSNLIFALSHTHAAPPLMEPDESLTGSDLLKAWIESLFDNAVQAIRSALEHSFEGTLEWHAGRCGLATVRDLVDPTSSVDRFVCGYAPTEVADDTLLLGRITDLSGRIQGTVVNYACHPTTLAWHNRAISPDFVGAMRETIESVTHAPAMFLLGVCGELAPRYQYVDDIAVADEHGRELGFAALSVLFGMEPPRTRMRYSGTIESGAPLAVWKHEARHPSTDIRSIQPSVELPLKNWPSADELEQQRLNCVDRTLEERLRRKRDIRKGLGDGRAFQLPITVWKLGDAILIGSCCEAYSILQQELRRRFSGNAIICMNLVNGSLGYLPPAELYETDFYTVWQTPFDRGSLEILLNFMMRTIHDLLSE